MSVFLKDIKKELQADRYKKGRNKDGSWKYEPPSLLSRQIKDYPKLLVSKFDQIVRQGIKSIDYSAMIKSETGVQDKKTGAALKYRVTVRFMDMLFNKEMSAETDIMTTDANGDIIYHQLPHVRENPVMLKCSCPDFRHRWEWELADQKALIGAPRKYKRETPLWPVGRPYANSAHKLGVCKHIHSMIQFLRSRKLLRGTL